MNNICLLKPNLDLSEKIKKVVSSNKNFIDFLQISCSNYKLQSCQK